MIIQPRTILTESGAEKMDGITQEKIYTQLFRAWNREVMSKKIQKIPDHENFLTQIRLLGDELHRQLKETGNFTIQLIIQKTLSNIEYMISDLLAIREEKIINVARSNLNFDENTLFSFEERFFDQIRPAFRGISKTKQQIQHPLLFSNIITSHSDTTLEKENHFRENRPIESKNDDLERFSVDSPKNVDNAEFDFTDELSEDDLEIPENDYSPDSSYKSENQENSNISAPNEEGSLTPPEIIQYQRILAVKDIDPFVGMDFAIYGPILMGEIAFIPEINANIFLEENMVEFLSS